MEKEKLNELIAELKKIEFDSFSVGVKYAKNEEEKKETAEQLIQAIEKSFSAILDKSAPQLIVLFNSLTKRFDFQIKSIYIYGKYCKFSRELPQTIHYCFKCKGRGCEKCDFTGKQSNESIQELISEIMIPEFQALEGKFHGAGREDKDVLMLGKGREFVFELIYPKKRKGNLNNIEKEINSKFKEKIQVKLIDFCEKEKVIEIKAKKNTKKYLAVIEFEEEVTDKIIEKIKKKLKKKIEVNQLTPLRKENKKELERNKWIELVAVREKDTQRIELEINCKSGTYVKEFISGDEGRTNPSIAGITGISCECIQLDVLEIMEN
ncbi:MAG: tRNA pseudouridine(54/55) synthase Pus10 [Candidatus Diapherotrites archaeon]